MTKQIASSVEDPDEGDSLRMAIESRTTFLREQAESLTLESFRRLLEEDLGMETFRLDNHKRLIKQLVHEVLASPGEKEVLGSAGGDTEGDISKHEDKEEINKEVENLEDQSGEENFEKPDDVNAASPSDNSENKEKALNFDEKDAEFSIRRAIMKRATYVRVHSESISLQQVRRLLETDLELQELQLDAHKQLVKKLVDEILCSSDEPTGEPKREKKRKEGERKEKADIQNPKKRENKTSGQQKRTRKDVQQKHKKPKSTSNSDEDVGEKNSEVGEDIDTEEFIKKIQKGSIKKSDEVKPARSKLIERLRQVIKACGLSVGPHIYRKAKQAPEKERDQVLVKELEAILSREGLSINASEKEIKAVRRRRERQKDLEDIDTSNIICEPRGRRQASMFFSPVYKKPEKKDDPNDEEDENSSDEEDENVSDEEDEDVANMSQDELAPPREDLTGDDESD